MTYRIALCAALAATIAATPGAAKTAPKPAALFGAADVDRIAPMVDHGCILGPNAKTQTPEQKIANCTAALADLAPMQAKAKTRAQRAGFAYLIASFDFARAGGYLGVDKVRSARVCTTAERTYAQISTVDATLFEADLAQALQTSRGAISRSAAACRKDFGTPRGAPPLLPQ